MAKPYSGKQVIKILTQRFGFVFVSQRGSHVKLRLVQNGKTITTIVPLHRSLAPGTLKGVLALAEIDEEDFKRKWRF